MIEELSTDTVEELKEKDAKIKELQEKIDELEKKFKDAEADLNAIDTKLERKVVDRTVEFNRLIKDKNRFIDNLSHDLATPLTCC